MVAGFVLCVTGLLPSANAADAPTAVEFRGMVYVSLDDLLKPDLLDGRRALRDWNRVIDVEVGARRVRFDEGADRIAIDDQPPRPLERPVLVLGGDFYIPAGECSAALGYQFEQGETPTVVVGESRLPLNVEPLDTPHLRTRVDSLRPVHRAIELSSPVRVRTHLHEDLPVVELPRGTQLLVRRVVHLDGVPHAIVTRADTLLESYALPLDTLNVSAAASSLDGTHLGAVLSRLAAGAADEDSARFGDRAALKSSIALTIDLCWSLLEYERDLFRFIPRLAAKNEGASVTLFMTGRWMAQHPEEMERLIELSREPGVDVVWGLHGWSHPKEQPFMNGFSPDEVRADALQLEHDLLEWGIVPSIFYRFPGLIHDEARLRAINAIDLISVDCDSWVSAMHLDRPPHRRMARGGSILLIHGNGNEPTGIPRFYQWMIENPGMKLGPLHQFISADQKVEVTTSPTTRPEGMYRERRRR